jgi:hypothetical protein
LENVGQSVVISLQEILYMIAILKGSIYCFF